MKLLFIRHGDPDYERDWLTDKGQREAELLSLRLSKMDITDFYVSTMGRARATSLPTLDKMKREATPCDWLREFGPAVERQDRNMRPGVAWDWLPQDWLKDERLLARDLWADNEVFRAAGIKESYERVTREFDAVLAEHGYVRNGLYYNAVSPNTDTLAFFCHFGVTCVLLSHLMNVSPMILWHGTAMAPSSVTTVYSEERRPGIASFRAAAIGDISHLYSAGEEPSFSARFCEVYGNGDRID